MEMLSYCLMSVFETWITYDGTGRGDTPRHDLQLHPRNAQLIYYVLWSRAWTMYIIIGVVIQVWWYLYVFDIQPFYECYMRHGSCLTGLDHLIDHGMTSNYIPDILNCYPRYMNQELEPWASSVVQWSRDDITCMDILLHHVMSVYEAWTTSDRVWSPHTPRHELQLQPRHDQLLLWIVL